MSKKKKATNEASACPISIRVMQDGSSHREASFYAIMGPLGAQREVALNAVSDDFRHVCYCWGSFLFFKEKVFIKQLDTRSSNPRSVLDQYFKV